MKHLSRILSTFAPHIGLIFVWVLFAILAGERFYRPENQWIMLMQTVVVGTAALGATLIIISGGIDLSVGSSIALGTMITAYTLNLTGSPLLALCVGVAGGALVGYVIGLLVIGHVGRVAAVIVGLVVVYLIQPFPLPPLNQWDWKLGLNLGMALSAGAVVSALGIVLNEKLIKRVELSPFIVTLGMWGALRGAAKGIGGNQSIYMDSTLERTWLNELLQKGDWGPFRILPPGVWIMLILAVLIAAMLRYTRFGRHIFAIGSNQETARLCGVRVERTKLMIYALAIGCAGLAAVMQFSHLGGMGDPTTAEGLELAVIAAVVIGGASLTGGEGSIAGTLVGALIMTAVANGCTKLGMDNWVQQVVTGAIIVAAVTLDRLRRRTATD